MMISSPIMNRAMSLLESSATSSDGRSSITSGVSVSGAPAAGISRNLTFPFVLYTLLEDASTLGFEDIVSWLPAGNGLKVHNTKDFEERIMGKYFQNQTRYKSFLRQLNFYGFSRVTKGQWKGCLYHEMFKRGSPSLCHNIKREKRPDSADRGGRGGGRSAGASQQQHHHGSMRSTKEEDHLLPTTSAYLVNTKAELPIKGDHNQLGDPRAFNPSSSMTMGGNLASSQRPCFVVSLKDDSRNSTASSRNIKEGESEKGKGRGRKRSKTHSAAAHPQQHQHQQVVGIRVPITGDIMDIAVHDEIAIQQNATSMALGGLSGLSNSLLLTNSTPKHQQQDQQIILFLASAGPTAIQSNTTARDLAIPPDIASEIIATFCAGGTTINPQQHRRGDGTTGNSS
jgi:hypothetical protein